MKTTTTRRAVLAGTAALPAAALPALAMPAADAEVEESPILRAFAEWTRTWSWASETGLDDDEGYRRADMLCEREDAIFDMPAQSEADIAAKIMIMARWDFCDANGRASLEADAARILADAGISYPQQEDEA